MAITKFQEKSSYIRRSRSENALNNNINGMKIAPMQKTVCKK